MWTEFINFLRRYVEVKLSIKVFHLFFEKRAVLVDSAGLSPGTFSFESGPSKDEERSRFLTGVAGRGVVGDTKFSAGPLRRTFCINGVSSNILFEFLAPGVASTWMGVLVDAASGGGDRGSLNGGSVLSEEGRVGVDLPLPSPLSLVTLTSLAAASSAVISFHSFT